MKALRCNRYGTPDTLVVEELPDPVPGPGDVVVDIVVSAVNFPDILFVADEYQVSIPLPFTPGSELAGVVSAVGAEVTGIAVGDRVTAAIMSGAFAERAVVPAAAVKPVPEGVDLAVAAASGVTFSTAWSALRSRAAVTPGEWVAITGAAGGVGSAAITVTKELGGSSLAVVANPAEAAFCAELGADAVLDLSTTADVKEAARELSGGGVDVVLDMVGGDLAEPLLRAQRRGGRFVTIGYASGSIPRIPLNLVMLKAVAVLGFEVRTFPNDHPDLAARDATEVSDLLRRGVGARIGARYPLDHAADALTDVAARKLTGKVLIDVRPE